MEKLQCQLLALPARRVAADNKRRFWWAIGATLIIIVGPIAVLCLFPVGGWIALGSFLALCLLAAVCWFVGMLRGIVVVPTLDDDVIESETRKKAKDKLKVSPQKKTFCSRGHVASKAAGFRELEKVKGMLSSWEFVANDSGLVLLINDKPLSRSFNRPLSFSGLSLMKKQKKSRVRIPPKSLFRFFPRERENEWRQPR